MAVFTLPLDPALAHYEFETPLDGVAYRFRLKWNARDESFNLNVLDQEGNQLRSGIKVVTDWSLLLRWVDGGRPAGDVVSVSLGDVARPARLGELGDSVVLTYVGEA